MDKFQRILFLQQKIKLKNIQLVGIDVSKTIVCYEVNQESLSLAINKIADYLLKIGIKISPKNKIMEAINNGFSEYKKIRNKNGVEIDELEFYKEFVIPRLNIKKSLSDKILTDIISIWKDDSLNIKSNSKYIEKLVKELQNRGIKVVTISDMLGDESHRALKRIGIYNIFDAHFTSGDFGVRKNKKVNSLFNKVLSTMKISKEQSCFIGNDYKDDIMGAINNGWKRKILVRCGNNARIKLSIPDLIFNNLDELYLALMDNKIFFLPDMQRDIFISSEFAKKSKSETNRLIYALRQKVKVLPDRNLREWAYRNYLSFHIGEMTRIGNNVEIRYPERIYIGDNCQINDDITILNEAPVIMGNNVMLARGIFIATHNHNWKLGMEQDDVPSWQKGDVKIEPVSIESNVWIGPNCTIESGVFIGHHSIVGANTHVPKGFYEPFSFIRGNSIKVENIKEKIEDAKKAFKHKL
ncbi:MAG TPA: HAD hydrolase-like protein [Candidatus Paceibacterota bacterium]|nr:HAD hydrolase-like protein [Candidatus Paceibacterota bacterium]HPT40353.1 HAD hydrolase-like protein [Candidatus Paceibacterota bacterium]